MKAFNPSRQSLTKSAIVLLQNYLQYLGFRAQIHFELEGCYLFEPSDKINKHSKLNFNLINQHLHHLKIDGEVVNEYWQNQWEYVSLFNGQSPLQEAQNLSHVIENLPLYFSQFYHVKETLIQPVVWSGDKGKLAEGSGRIFTNDTRSVHIPNAIQLNVSVIDNQGNNLIADEYFGEYLQSCFLTTSLACCLLYLPEEAAFERLVLKTRYGLAQELCSPVNISGGHQGSIALYKELGKHNQKMGEEPLLYDVNNQVLSVQQNWQKTARIEHRLGASSCHYDPFVNVLYGLLNVVNAVEVYQQKQCKIPLDFIPVDLPKSLFTHQINKNEQSVGAVELFEKSNWFSQSINDVQQKTAQLKLNDPPGCLDQLGDKIKQAVLQNYTFML